MPKNTRFSILSLIVALAAFFFYWSGHPPLSGTQFFILKFLTLYCGVFGGIFGIFWLVSNEPLALHGAGFCLIMAAFSFAVLAQLPLLAVAAVAGFLGLTYKVMVN